MFVYFGFNIWHAAVAYFNGATIEQFAKFMTWRKVLSYKIQKIFSDFCFDHNTKWRLNQITFRFLFHLLSLTFSFEGETSKFADSRIFLELIDIFLLIS